jgi:VWFA-related protein
MLADVTRLTVVALASLLLAQAQQPPTFRSGIDVVRLDVTVLDAGRHPVADLAQTDFTITVDGRPQPIVGFERFVIPPPERPTAAWMREVAPDVRSNALGEPRLLVILMDDANTPTDPFMIRTAKDVASRVIDELRPSDMASVVFTMDNRHAQDFTSDPQLLRAAVDQFSAGIRGNGVAGRYVQKALHDTVAFLHQSPHSRSAIILISPDPPGTRDVEDALESPTASTLRSVADMQDAAGAGHDAPVPIYGFNIAGLVAPNAGFGRPQVRLPRSSEPPYTEDEARRADETFRTLANLTGGRAVVEDNAPGESVRAVLDEMSALYTIAYRAAYPLEDGKSHRVHVAVGRPGVSVQAADRTLVSATPKPKVLTLASPLVTALSELLPRSDLPMAVTVAPFVIAASGQAKGPATGVLTTLRVRRAAPTQRTTDEVNVLAKIFTVEGKEVTTVRQHAALKLRPADADAQVDILTVIPIKPGRYNLRLSAHSDGVDKTGSVYTDVTVPDFGRDRLSMSGVLMSATPASQAAPADAFARIVPVVPTSERAFASTDRVSAFARVYQHGSPAAAVNVAIHVVDEHGSDAATSSVSLDALRFGRGEADITYDVPLQTLAPGSYLLSLRAAIDSKTSVERDVRFQVR